MTHDALLDLLNPPQREAVTHTEGPLLVLAGAGSGKTRTLTFRIAYLIRESKAPANQILAVTFTNKAAEEMRNRVLSLLPAQHRPPLVTTFHSFGARVLRRWATRLDYGRDFTICDTDDQKRLMKRLYKRLNLSEKELPVRLVLSSISKAKNLGQTPESYRKQTYDRDGEWIAEAFKAYQKELRQSNAMDFDDLILLPGDLFRRDQEVRAYYADWYQYIMIDEYQDTNTPQYELLINLSAGHRNICAVGDEDQSIYRFRGADINNILRFEKDFPGTRLVKLERNYRSTQTILDAAGTVVANNSQRKGKKLWTDRNDGRKLVLFGAPDARSEASWTADQIQSCIREGQQRLAVLYRTNFQSREFEEALSRRRIPYRLVGGLSFYARKEVKDALAYLRASLNPADNISLLRIINRPARGIGRTTLDLLQALADSDGLNLWSSLRNGLEQNRFPGRAHMALSRFVEVLQACRSVLVEPLPQALDKILDLSGYVAALEKEGSEEAADRILNLRELVNVAREAFEGGLETQEFLDHASLRADSDDYDSSAQVTLMTLHNAKGLEFSSVFLAGCEEGLFPHQRAIDENDVEEERRLCYVGMTRAEDRLHLSFSLNRRFFGRDSGAAINRPSRFLDEIPRHLIEDVSPPQQADWPSSGDSSSMRPPWMKRSQRPKVAFAGTTHNDVNSVRSFLDQMPSKKRERSKGLVKGALVEHPKLGRGKILALEKSGDDIKATVLFPGLGIKKMLQSYAKLTPV